MKAKRLGGIVFGVVVFCLLYYFIWLSNEKDPQFLKRQRTYLKTEEDLTELQKLFKNDEFAQTLLPFNRNSSGYCEDLFSDWSKYNMSKEYYKLLPDFEARYIEAIKNEPVAEGHSNQVPEKMRILHLLAGISSVKTVCETGFNYGHSSFNFLTANSQLKVHSFDIGSHVYSRRMAKSLQELFTPGRLTVHFGDSTVEVPKVKAAGKLPLCDLLFVDGGHTYPVAKADLINFATHASKENVILFDDYPTNWGMDFGRAWEELLVKPGKTETPVDKNLKVAIKEVFRCTKLNLDRNFQRGFVVGKVVLNK